MINSDVIHECTNKKLPFPEVIKRLSVIDIERYYTDLVRMEKIYYSRNGESYIERMPIENIASPGAYFDENKIITVLRSIQKGEIDYSSFVRGIVTSGAVSYTVYIDGKQAHYLGRKGEIYVEQFPF